MKEKYRARYSELQRKFIAEREEILRLIRDECQDIISEAQLLLIRKKSGGVSDSTMAQEEEDCDEEEEEISNRGISTNVWRAKRDYKFDDHVTPFSATNSSSGGFKINAHEYLRSNRKASSLTRSVDSTASRLSHHSNMYAEMLSPEETQELVRSVLEKVSVNSWHEFQSAYNSGESAPRLDVRSSHATGTSFDFIGHHSHSSG